MNEKHKTTFLTKEQARAKKKWFLFDASGKTLGRLASEIAKVLNGKHTVEYTPHVDSGDHVIVVNAEKVQVTGNKEAQKNYYYHTGAMSGLREVPFSRMKERKPEYILKHAILGMLPKTRLGKAQAKKLHLFIGPEHNMKAQKPITVNV